MRLAHPSRLCFSGFLLLSLLSSACQVGPLYRPPQSKLPDRWATDLPDASPTWPAPDWWREFNAPELAGLIEQARHANPSMAAAVYRVREAEAQAEIAGAPLLPSLQAGGSIGPQEQLSLSGLKRHHVLYEGLFSVRYELDFWGKNRAALESAQASAIGVRFAQQVIWITTSTGVASLYFKNLALLDEIRIGHDNLSRAQHTLDALMLAESRGTISHLAVVEQQTTVANLEATLPPLQASLAAAHNALAILVGIMPEDLKLSGGSLLHLAQPKIRAGVPSELLGRRPDIQEAEASLKAANADVRVARAQFFPSVSLPLDAGIESMTVSGRTLAPINAYSVLGSITQPIFEGGALRGQLDQREARYQELLVGSYRQAVLSAFEEVETALAAVRAADAEKEPGERAQALAEWSLALALAGLHGGTGTTLDVLQSESALLTAQDAVVQRRLAYVQALLGLIKALGGGWQS